MLLGLHPRHQDDPEWQHHGQENRSEDMAGRRGRTGGGAGAARQVVSKHSLVDRVIKCIRKRALVRACSSSGFIWLWPCGFFFGADPDDPGCRVSPAGYLAAALFLHENHELNMLLVNTIQRVRVHVSK